MAAVEGFRGENTPFSMKHRLMSSVKQQRPFGNHSGRVGLLKTSNVYKILRYAVSR